WSNPGPDHDYVPADIPNLRVELETIDTFGSFCGPALGSADYFVDYVQVTVTYTEPAPDDDGDGVPDDGTDVCPDTPTPPRGGLLSDGCDWVQELEGSVNNPARPTECGVNFSLVFDRSASFDSGDL